MFAARRQLVPRARAPRARAARRRGGGRPGAAGPRRPRFAIIGAGTTAHAAIEALTLKVPDAEIVLVSDEKAIPKLDLFDSYGAGSSLSEGLLDAYTEWRRHTTSRLMNEPHLMSDGVTVLLGHEGVRPTRSAARAPADGKHEPVHFDACLIATSGRPVPQFSLDTSALRLGAVRQPARDAPGLRRARPALRRAPPRRAAAAPSAAASGREADGGARGAASRRRACSSRSRARRRSCATTRSTARPCARSSSSAAASSLRGRAALAQQKAAAGEAGRDLAVRQVRRPRRSGRCPRTSRPTSARGSRRRASRSCASGS